VKKFFIVGCPRSGTTMLQQALNRHSRVLIPPETKFFFSFLGQPLRGQLRHIDRLEADLGIRLPRPARVVRSVDEGRGFYELMARRYAARFDKEDLTHFGEKTPEHTGLLPRIFETFPDARVVVIYRDGRDVASSLTRVPWMSSNLYVNFAVWLYYDWVIRRFQAAGPRRDVCFVRYEDLVAAPETELRSVLGFLGLPYEPAVAQGYGNREGVPDRERPWKARALEPITPGRVGAFRGELTEAQVATLERLGGGALRALGYPLVTDAQAGLSPFFYLRLGCDLAGLACRLPWRSLAREFACRLAEPFLPAASPRALSPEPSCLQPSRAPAVDLCFSRGSAPASLR
jgi:hypothetical protein